MLKYFAMLFLFVCQYASANTVSCTSDSGLPERTITVPLGNIKATATTSSGNATTPQVIYSFTSWFGGNIKLDCHSSDNAATLATRKAFIVPNAGQNFIDLTRLVITYKIFPTSVEGIGVSFEYGEENAVGNKTEPFITRSAYDINGTDAWTDRLKISIWKMPSFKDNLAANNFYTLNERFQFVHALTLNDGSSYDSVPYPASELSNSWTLNRINLHLTGTMEVHPSTCTFQNKTVWMGHHRMTPDGQPSAWKDASFTVTCPAAWGMGNEGVYDDNYQLTSKADISNWGYMVQVLPRTNVVDNSNGIIALKSGDAQGYGIQLAWGKPAVQSPNGTPANPVTFNTDVHSFFIPDVGFPSFSGGIKPVQEFPLAARYVRLPDEAASPGKAEASVEVVVSYL